MPSIIEDLRAATQTIHLRLHGHPAFQPVLQDAPDVDGYTNLLTQLYGFHAPAEAWVFDAAAIHLPELDDLQQRRKMPFLEADLSVLGRPVHPESPAQQLAWPITATRPSVLGCLYVIEGATLGGRDLARAIGPALHAHGLPGTTGRQFLLAYEPRQGAMWRQYCQVLTAAAAKMTQSERQELCQSAIRSFELMEGWLTRGYIRD